MKVRFLVLTFLFSAVIFLGCSKDNMTDPGDQDNNEDLALTQQQEMEIVASQVAASSGGVMMDISTAGEASDGDLYSMAKLDTTIQYQWITYQASLSFFNDNGQEMPMFISGITDSITASSALSGDTTYAAVLILGATWNLNLNRSAQLQVGNILSNTIVINGSSSDQSHYAYNGKLSSIDVQLDCQLSIQNVVVPLDSPYYIPTSGTIKGELAGTIQRPSASKEVSIPYTVTFNGDETVTITLDNRGISFSVNLLTGQISV